VLVSTAMLDALNPAEQDVLGALEAQQDFEALLELARRAATG
jgi:hypothetical protein